MANFYFKKILLFIFFILKIITIQAQDTSNIDVETFYDLEMPPFGQFRISGIVDIQNLEFTLKGSPQKNKYNLGLLTIENPFIQVTNKTGFGAKATVTIFGKKATLGILEFKPGKRIVYNITPANAINIPITPWQTVTIKNFTLLITPKTMELGATIQAFNHPNLIKFGISRPQQEESEVTAPALEETESVEQPNNYAEIILKEIKPSDILSYLSNSEFNNIEINNARFRIDNPFSKTAEHPITIECIINLEKLKLPLLTNISKIESLIEIDKTTGISIETKIPDTTIMETSILSDISLQIILPPKVATQQTGQSTPPAPGTQTTRPQKKRVGKPSIFLSGIANLDLPLVGKFSSEFSSIYDKGIFNFETKINRNINFENIFDLKNVSLKYSSLGNFEIIGDTSLFDLDLIGSLKFSKTKTVTPSSQTQTQEIHETQQATPERNPTQTTPQTAETQIEQTTREPKSLKIGNYFVEFYAQAKTNKPIQPFAKIPAVKNIKQIANISIANPGVGMRPDKTLYITGQTDILSFKSDVILEVKNSKEITLKSRPPQDWRLSDAIEGLRETVFDEIDMSDIQIVISTFQHFDSNLNLTLNKGINFIAGAQLTGGAFNSAKSLISALDQKLRVAGSIGDSTSDLYFSASIPVKEITISEKAILKNISFFLSGDGPTVGLKTQIEIQPSKQDNFLLFSGSVSIDPTAGGLTLGASMIGTWKHALGIKGIDLSSVGITATLPSLTNMGLTGILYFGKNKEIKLAAKYSIDGQIVLMGEYSGQILLEDLIAIALKTNSNLDIDKLKNKLPDIGFENLLFKFAPVATQIDEIPIDPGISLKGTIIVLNKRGSINLNIGSDGIFAQGVLDKFNIGPIEISGSGLDGIYGTIDDGPILDFILSPEEQHLILSGLMDLKIAKGQGDIHLGTDQIKIFLLAKLFNLFETTFDAYSIGSIKEPTKLDFIFKAEATNEINEYLIKKITEGLDIFGKAATNIKDQQEQINKLEEQIKVKQDSINQIEEDIKTLKDEYQKIKMAKKEYQPQK
ncbi:MAG: hypothetical protein ABIF12_03420 [bacterium]